MFLFFSPLLALDATASGVQHSTAAATQGECHTNGQSAFPTRQGSCHPINPHGQTLSQLRRGEAGEQEAAVTPAWGHHITQAQQAQRMYRFQGQGREGRSPGQSQATSFTQTLTLSVFGCWLHPRFLVEGQTTSVTTSQLR